MTSISAHEDKGRVLAEGRGPSKGAQVTDGVARSVQEIKGPVAEEVIGVEATDLHAAFFFECNLPDRSTLHVAVKHSRVATPRPTGPRSYADAGSYDELGAVGEFGHVPDVVEVVVRPDDSFDVGAADVQAALVGIEHRHHVRSRRHHCSRLDQGDHCGCGVPPVRADAEVEHHVLAAVRDQEAVDGRVEAREAVNLGLPEEPWVQSDRGVSAIVSVARDQTFCALIRMGATQP